SPSPSSSLKPLRQLDVFQIARDARALTESVRRAFPERQVPVRTQGQLAADWVEYLEELNTPVELQPRFPAAPPPPPPPPKEQVLPQPPQPPPQPPPPPP